jgi:hypothetical protein
MILLNVITYNAAINAREKCQQWQQTLGLLAMMQQSGRGPDVTFLALVRGPFQERQAPLGRIHWEAKGRVRLLGNCGTLCS